VLGSGRTDIRERQPPPIPWRSGRFRRCFVAPLLLLEPAPAATNSNVPAVKEHLMRRRLVTGVKQCAVWSCAALVLGVFAAPAASAQQTVNFYVGGFVPSSEDSRTPNDVLVNDLQLEGLAFDISDFHGPTFGGEYLVGLGDKFEAGLGVGYQTRSVQSVYADV